jgi:tetratricopeptide (TPR) repeat protein
MWRKHLILVWAAIVLVGISDARSATTNPDEYFREGYSAFVSRNWEQATQLYSKAIELDPQNVEAYFQRGLTREIAGHHDQAIKDYEKTLELDPHCYLAMEYLARLYDAKGEYAAAANLYARALPLMSDPKWQSMIRWWLTEARRKMREGPDSVASDKPRGVRGR